MIAAHAAWHMGHWEAMATYVDTVDSADTPQSQTAAGAFLRAALCVKEDAFDLAKVRGRGGEVSRGSPSPNVPLALLLPPPLPHLTPSSSTCSPAAAH